MKDDADVANSEARCLITAISRTTEKWSDGRTAENQLCRPTVDVYGELLREFDYLNDVVIEPTFGVRLPQVVFTLARTRRFVAAFLLRPWGRRNHGDVIAHEIMFNAYYFRSTQEVMQAMAHEMLHLAQAVAKEMSVEEIFGEPSTNGYHNKKWADAMLQIGLRPVSAENQNLMTGQRVSDIVLDGGPFQVACHHYIEMGGSMLWTPAEEGAAANGGVGLSAEEIAARKRREELKRLSKASFLCPKCPQQVWGNWKSKVSCTICGVPMERDKSKDANEENGAGLR